MSDHIPAIEEALNEACNSRTIARAPNCVCDPCRRYRAVETLVRRVLNDGVEHGRTRANTLAAEVELYLRSKELHDCEAQGHPADSCNTGRLRASLDAFNVVEELAAPSVDARDYVMPDGLVHVVFEVELRNRANGLIETMRSQAGVRLDPDQRVVRCPLHIATASDGLPRDYNHIQVTARAIVNNDHANPIDCAVIVDPIGQAQAVFTLPPRGER